MLDEYCMLIGADSDAEYSILENANIAQSTPGDLRGDLSLNAQKLANTYISLGLGEKSVFLYCVTSSIFERSCD